MDGAATEKELLESWRLNRGTIKSPRDVDVNVRTSALQHVVTPHAHHVCIIM